MLCSYTVNILTLVLHEWILLSDKLIFTYKILENINIYLTWQVDFHPGKLELESLIRMGKLV